MIEPAFIVFEIMNFFLFALCFWHAVRQSGSKAAELLFALLFGVFLEWMTIEQLGAYEYGEFLVMIEGAPLCIGCGWAVIIYSGMALIENWQMPDFARPFLVGFYALNLDIAMDVIAIRQGFWSWVIPFDSQWHGVPWGNFWAWFIVVASYSGLLYWLRGRGLPNAPERWLRLLYPLAAFLGSVIILALTNGIFVTFFIQSELLSAVSMLLLLWLGTVVIYVTRPKVKENPRLNGIILLPALLTHLVMNGMGFVGGFYQQQPVLAVVGLMMFAISLGFMLWPWWVRHTLKKGNTPGV